MHWQELAAGLGGSLGLPDLAFDEERRARLSFASGLILDLEGAEQGTVLQVTASVGDDAGSADTWRSLLSANLYGQGTGGSVLAIDPETDEILLTRRFELAHADFAGLEMQLNQFLAFAEEWLAELTPKEAE